MGDFAAVVRRYMTMRNMSLRVTARAAGYSDHTMVSKVLNGHKPVTACLAAALDDALAADGEIIAAAMADDVVGYLGADPAPLPHPPAIDAASVR